MIRPCIFAIAVLTASLSTVPLHAEESVFQQQDESEVIYGSPFEKNIEVKQGGDIILEFQAWYRSTVPAGFYSSMNVTWNGERLTRILDRPEKIFVDGLDREFPIRSPQGWLTAILPEAGAAGMPSPYYIPRETLDIATYRFRLTVDKPGIYPLSIINGLKDPQNQYYNTLVVANIRIYQAEE